MSCLLSVDPQRRISAEELLRRIHAERQKVIGSAEPQNLMRKKDDETRESDNDSDYETFVKSSASSSGRKFGNTAKSLGLLRYKVRKTSS